ncbi:hypothetical protein C8R48DRAFT_704061 [Suillus tomentosus]|nr:hypothetical protein C8R48DRAFT_704061 [Suillus tomentosus]
MQYNTRSLNFLLGEDEWLCSKRRQVSWVKHRCINTSHHGYVIPTALISKGTPRSHTFRPTLIAISTHFGAQNIIINLTFCGDWAGSVYAASDASRMLLLSSTR